MDNFFNSGYSLVVGSGLSGYEYTYDELLSSLKLKFDKDDQIDSEDFFLAIEQFNVELDIPETVLRDFVNSKMFHSKADPILAQIAEKSWKSIISTSLDENLSNKFIDEFDKGVTSRYLSIISSKKLSPIHGSIPYYSLMGSLRDDRKAHAACLTNGEYLKRRRDWRDMLAGFPDYNKGSPLVFIGTNRDKRIVADLINELLSMTPGLPNQLYFFKGDPCATDSSIVELVEGESNITILDSTLKKWVTYVSHESRQLSLPFGSVKGVNYEALQEVSDRIIVVPRSQDLPEFDHSSKNRLIDYIFRPSVINWEALNQNFDFHRCITKDIQKSIDAQLASGNSGVISLAGEAGVGKTITMKRVAFNYANEDLLSLWIKKSLNTSSSTKWSLVSKQISDALKEISNPRVVLFFDGSVESSDHLDELIRSLSNESFVWCLVVCQRKTDEAFSNESGIFSENNPFAKSSTSFPTKLTKHEIELLPEYLLHINAAPNIEIARKIVNTEAEKGTNSDISHSASDVLCTLWYLFPQSKASISGSLIDEYQSLGGVEGVITELAKESASRKEWAKKAYELVTTCSGHNVALPVEVLVRTLEIDYEDWLSTCVNGDPLWGLIYAEDYKDGESFAYRTRNEIVTKVLLRTLNGGAGSHIGEFRCLKEILSSCDLGSPVYRETASSILLQRKKELKKFTYSQGLELFDEALESLPYEDRAISHHRGLWIRDKGNNLALAYDAIAESLVKDDYPHSERTENQGNIHTSMASCVVRELEEPDQTHSEYSMKLRKIESHIEEAEKNNPFDMYNHHVSANMFIKIASKFKGIDEELHTSSLANAVKIISNSLSLIPKGQFNKSSYYYDSVVMIQHLEEQLFQISDNFESNDEMARSLFELKRDQTGFYVLLKVLISEASSKNKGSLYNRAASYLKKSMEIIEERGESVDKRIIECRADLEIKWKVISGSVSPPDWSALEQDLSVLAEHASSASNALHSFYRAVALYHLNDVSIADAIFNQLRRTDIPGDIRRTRRCFLLDANGNPKAFQGQIISGHLKKFIYCPEISSEILCSNEFKEKKDTLVRFYIAFSFQGPIATKRNNIDSN